MNLKLAQPDQVKGEIEQLQTLINQTKGSEVSRSNIEVLLLVFQLLFEHESQLENYASKLGGRLLAFTEDMRAGDSAIRARYLAPVFESAVEAVPDLKDQLAPAPDAGE